MVDGDMMLCAYIRQLSSFRAPTFINLTVATCHIQYSIHFSELMPNFFHEKTYKTRKYSRSAIFVWKMAANSYLAQ